MLTIGSLFSGIGGLELGLERAGLGPVLWQCEIDPYCRRVLARHWPDTRRYEDVRRITDSARVDLVCGGFPCQPVSVAGARLAQDDPRWLWPEFARILGTVEPSIVVAENVLGLRTAGLRDVLADLADLGFDVEWSCLAAGDVGAPHRRRRVFIVATHPDRIDVREQPGWLSRACGALRTALADIDGEERSVADTEGERSDAWRLSERAQASQPNTPIGAGNAPDSDRDGQQQPQGAFGSVRGWASDSGWRDAPPAIRGVDDGLPEGLDPSSPHDPGGEGEARDVEAPDGWRVAALGNAVVPQVAEVIGRAIMATQGC